MKDDIKSVRHLANKRKTSRERTHRHQYLTSGRTKPHSRQEDFKE